MTKSLSVWLSVEWRSSEQREAKEGNMLQAVRPQPAPGGDGLSSRRDCEDLTEDTEL